MKFILEHCCDDYNDEEKEFMIKRMMMMIYRSIFNNIQFLPLFLLFKVKTSFRKF